MGWSSRATAAKRAKAQPHPTRFNGAASVIEAEVAKALGPGYLTETGRRKRPGSRLVDVGTGTGVYLSLSAKEPRLEGYEVVGIEPSPHLLDHARAAHPTLRFHAGTAYAAQEADASADVVTANFVFIHLRSPDLALLEIQRVLRPGGLLYVVDVNDATFRGPDPIAQMVRAHHAHHEGDRTIVASELRRWRYTWRARKKMRPWQHARASARRSGRSWRDDLAIHEFVDSTRVALADLRHRMVLHNCDLGPAVAATAFPALPHAAEVARAHAREDLGADVSLAWWLDRCDPRRLPRERERSSDALVQRACERWSLREPDGPRAVLALLELPVSFAPSHDALARAVFANSAGIALVRAVLGPPREEFGRSGNTVVFDPAYCAEAMIYQRYRRIPSLAELADTLSPTLDLDLEALVTSHSPMAGEVL